jgi:hypothetical protein
MNKIAYSKVNENIFYYIDINSKLNMMENLNNVEYTANIEDKINAIGVNTSYNDEYILYNGIEIGNEFLSIISFDRFRRGDLQNIAFRFETSINIEKINVSKNRNRVAIVFMVHDYYSVLMNGHLVGHEVNFIEAMDNYYLHVYDFSEDNSRLIFQKIYNREINVAFSDIDTIAIASRSHEHCSQFEVYDLNTGNRLIFGDQLPILNSSRITCMHYIPSTDHLPNYIVIVTKANPSIYHYRVIDLRENTFREIWNSIVPNNITCIDIARNGRIALGGESGVLVYHSFGAGSSTYFQERAINGLSFSLNALYLGVNFRNFFQHNGIVLYRPENISVLSLQQGVPGVDTIIFRDPVFLDDDNFGYAHGFEDDLGYEFEDHYDEQDERDRVRPVDEMGAHHAYNRRAQLPPVRQVPEPDVEIQDPQLDIAVPNQPSNPQKLQIHGNDNCFDLSLLSEEKIGDYLSSDPDNIVIFYKNPGDAGFLATCLTFSRLKKYLKDPLHVFYTCIPRYDFRNYHRNQPEFLKIPTQAGNLFVDYQLMKQKYMQRQNMIFLEHSRKVERTITYDASFNMAFVSGNHCQDGSVIDVYNIIF